MKKAKIDPLLDLDEFFPPQNGVIIPMLNMKNIHVFFHNSLAHLSTLGFSATVLLETLMSDRRDMQSDLKLTFTLHLTTQNSEHNTIRVPQTKFHSPKFIPNTFSTTKKSV